MKKRSEQLIKKLIPIITDNQRDQMVINNIKKELAEYRIMGGRIQEIFENPTLLHDADIREILLLCEQIASTTNNSELSIRNIFTPAEIKEARQFDGLIGFEGELMDFPITFDRVIKLSDKEFVTTISVKMISKLLDNKLLNYNFEIQREGTKVKRRDSFILVPTIVQKNVNEISELLQKDQLRSTMVAFNAAIRTADHGEELSYNRKKGTLTINAGTRLDMLDGMHRCLGAKKAYARNSEIDFEFVLFITNFSTAEAQSYQRQIAKATPISLTRQRELETDNLSNVVIDSLRSDSELQNRVGQGSAPRYFANEIVTYRTLVEGIDREFKMVSRLDAYETADYLKDFFQYLFGLFSDHFITNIEKNLKESFLAHNKMFLGYLVLARRMKEENVPLRQIEKIIKEDDFLINEETVNKFNASTQGRLIKQSEAAIIEFFENIDLGG